MNRTHPARDIQERDIVREAEIRDIQAILYLYEQLFSNTTQSEQNQPIPTPKHEQAFLEIAQNPNHHLLVAEVDGFIQGTLALIVIPNLSHAGKPWGIIENVVVNRSYRRYGIGSLLMQRALQLAKERDCFRVILSSSKHRNGSHKFYESVGLLPYGYSFTIYL